VLWDRDTGRIGRPSHGAPEWLGEIQNAVAAVARASNLNPNDRQASEGTRRTSTAGRVAFNQG